MTLEILTADSLSDTRHGFFTRRGGASSGIFAGLNCGPGSSDQAECVRINRGRVAEAMQVRPDQLISLAQIHSPDVITVTEPFTTRPKADAMVTTTPGLALGILTADCAPVLFADADAGVVGAAHSGWKGALTGVLEATIGAMQALGAQNITAVVGPCIAQPSYEVTLGFMDQFMDIDPDYARFFAGGHDADHVQFDLPGLVVHRLRIAGAHAEWTRHDTYTDPDRFYSYRRTTHKREADYGRQISVIRV